MQIFWTEHTTFLIAPSYPEAGRRTKRVRVKDEVSKRKIKILEFSEKIWLCILDIPDGAHYVSHSTFVPGVGKTKATKGNFLAYSCPFCRNPRARTHGKFVRAHECHAKGAYWSKK